jgi:hypothetical protein
MTRQQRNKLGGAIGAALCGLMFWVALSAYLHVSGLHFRIFSALFF